jgi:heme-degrading monooxygenase HmoA
MHVTIRHYSGTSELAEALAGRADDVRALISAIDGFNAYYLVRGTDGDATSISVFETAAGGEESSRVAAAWLRENLPDLQVGAPAVTSGEAVLSF